MVLDVDKLRDQISDASSQIHAFQEQIRQSESNLAAQKEVTSAQMEETNFDAIQRAKREHLELLANDTGMDLDEMDTGWSNYFQIIYIFSSKNRISFTQPNFKFRETDI